MRSAKERIENINKYVPRKRTYRYGDVDKKTLITLLTEKNYAMDNLIWVVEYHLKELENEA